MIKIGGKNILIFLVGWKVSFFWLCSDTHLCLTFSFEISLAHSLRLVLVNFLIHLDNVIRPGFILDFFPLYFRRFSLLTAKVSILSRRFLPSFRLLFKILLVYNLENYHLKVYNSKFYRIRIRVVKAKRLFREKRLKGCFAKKG